MQTQKFISIAAISAQISTLFAFICRMFPEKAIFLVLIRIAATVALFFIWRFATEQQTKQIFAFIGVGSIAGLIVGYWDELPILYSVYPFEFLLGFIFFILILLGVIAHVAIKTNNTQES